MGGLHVVEIECIALTGESPSKSDLDDLGSVSASDRLT
jgi:hypothetical protein